MSESKNLGKFKSISQSLKKLRELKRSLYLTKIANVKVVKWSNGERKKEGGPFTNRGNLKKLKSKRPKSE